MKESFRYKFFHQSCARHQVCAMNLLRYVGPPCPESLLAEGHRHTQTILKYWGFLSCSRYQTSVGSWPASDPALETIQRPQVGWWETAETWRTRKVTGFSGGRGAMAKTQRQGAGLQTGKGFPDATSSVSHAALGRLFPPHTTQWSKVKI